MKLSWSMISILSRFLAVGIGIVQSIAIVKILSVEEYGLIGLVGSIAAVVGVYQNLGISSGSTREISAAKGRSEAFKVFIGSLIVRYAISLPLVLGMYLLADYIGEVKYARPQIVFPIKIFAFVLAIQALQSVLNSVIQGLKHFKFLFIFQIIIALISILIYIPTIIFLGFIGYFYALLLFNLLSTFVLGIYCAQIFKGYAIWPNKKEITYITKAVFKIGLFVYVVKIIFTQWQKLGPLVLGTYANDQTLGILTFALLVSSKVMTISDAITDVTLPSMTEIYERSKDKFKESFLVGNSKGFVLILFTSIMFIMLKYDIFIVVDIIFSFLGKESILSRYGSSFVIIDPLILAFWSYSHINLLKSGIAIPSKKLWGAIFSYITMFVVTIVIYKFLNLDPLMAFSIAMGIGALLAYILFIFFIKWDVGFFPISKTDIIYSLLSTPILVLYYLGFSPIILVSLYILVTYGFYIRFIKKNNKVS